MYSALNSFILDRRAIQVFIIIIIIIIIILFSGYSTKAGKFYIHHLEYNLIVHSLPIQYPLELAVQTG